jgi:hypothetical protein
MGYETAIDLYSVLVRPDKFRSVDEAIAAAERGGGGHHWMVGLLKMGRKGHLCWNDVPVGKWKSHEEFIREIAAWCSRGWVSFRSREGDGAAWAYEFDGTGGYRECSARRVAGIKAAATRRTRAATVGAARPATRRTGAVMRKRARQTG